LSLIPFWRAALTMVLECYVHLWPNTTNCTWSTLHPVSVISRVLSMLIYWRASYFQSWNGGNVILLENKFCNNEWFFSVNKASLHNFLRHRTWQQGFPNCNYNWRQANSHDTKYGNTRKEKLCIQQTVAINAQQTMANKLTISMQASNIKMQQVNLNI
jgi:hypothetical protein